MQFFSSNSEKYWKYATKIVLNVNVWNFLIKKAKPRCQTFLSFYHKIFQKILPALLNNERYLSYRFNPQISPINYHNKRFRKSSDYWLKTWAPTDRLNHANKEKRNQELWKSFLHFFSPNQSKIVQASLRFAFSQLFLLIGEFFLFICFKIFLGKLLNNFSCDSEKIVQKLFLSGLR